MRTYLVKVPGPGGEGWDYGVFKAANLAGLAWAMEDWCDPSDGLYRPLKGGMWVCHDGGGDSIAGEDPTLGLSGHEYSDEELEVGAPDAISWKPIPRAPL